MTRLNMTDRSRHVPVGRDKDSCSLSQKDLFRSTKQATPSHRWAEIQTQYIYIYNVRDRLHDVDLNSAQEEWLEIFEMVNGSVCCVITSFHWSSSTGLPL